MSVQGQYMTEIEVYNLQLQGPAANPGNVSFSTLPNHSPYILPIQLSSVLSRKPLRVMVIVPTGENIYNLRQYEGQTIILVGHSEHINVLQSE